MPYEVDFLPIGDSHGDAICMRYGNPQIGYAIDIVDGGYTDTGQAILEHLDKVYQSNTVNTVVLTHADDDHARGLIPVLENCRVGSLRMNCPWHYAAATLHHYHGNYTLQGLIDYMKEKHHVLVELEDIARRRNITVLPALQGDMYGALRVLSPSPALYTALVPDMDKTPPNYGPSGLGARLFERVTTAIQNVGERWDIETLQENPPATGASNEASVIHLFEYDGFRLLLTGDVGPVGLTQAHAYAVSIGQAAPLKVMQIPHQGSRRNVTPSVLDAWLGPRLPQGSPDRGSSYCSVGGNKDDHPRKVVQNAFRRRGYPVQVGRNMTVAFTNPPRQGWNTVPSEPLWPQVEDYS